MRDNITEEEKIFCELYVCGRAPFGGNAEKCYLDVFHPKKEALANHYAKDLLNRKDIQGYINELEAREFEEAKYVKRFLSQNLKRIIEETSSKEYRDRRGTVLSPAPLRSVAVNASRALMELYPVKEAQVNKLNIDSDNEGGITFNLVVPETKKDTNT